MSKMSEIPTLPPARREQLPLDVQAYLRVLEAQVATLQAQVEKLQAQVQENSQNSSRPPSADPASAPPRPKRAKSKRKRGGQPGHRGQQRVLLEASAVTEVVQHWPPVCPGCQHDLAAERHALGVMRRQQVWELPPVQAVVTEHRYATVACPRCERKVSVQRPAHVPPGAFGAHLTSLVACLNGRYRLSKREVASLLSTAFGVNMSSASVVRSCAYVSDALAAPYADLQTSVAQSAAANVDETGWKQAGQRRWLWVAVTPTRSLFHLARSRKGRELDTLLGHNYAGLVTSDRFSAYLRLPPAQRQVCWAPLKRDLTAFSETTGAAAPWGTRALAVVSQMFALWHRFRHGTLDREALQAQMMPQRTTFAALLAEGATRRHSNLRGLCANLKALEPALWNFLATEGVEPTNNAAERALRPAVLWRKGSFGSDSTPGLRFVERFLSVATTCRQQGRHLLAFLTEALSAFWAAQPSPLLATP